MKNQKLESLNLAMYVIKFQKLFYIHVISKLKVNIPYYVEEILIWKICYPLSQLLTTPLIYVKNQTLPIKRLISQQVITHFA